MRLRSVATRAAITGALALGLGLGFASQALPASAQTTPPAATAQASDSLASRFLDQLATALGIDRAALDSAMSSAASSTAAAGVADGTISQERADELVARAQAGSYGSFFGRGGPGGRHGGVRVGSLREAITAAAAQALGITADELRTALSDGQSMAELAAANNTTEQAVTDAAVAAARTELAAAVSAGTLTQEQADAYIAHLEAEGLHLGGHGPRGGRAHSTESVPTETTTSTSDA